LLQGKVVLPDGENRATKKKSLYKTEVFSEEEISAGIIFNFFRITEQVSVSLAFF